MPYIDRDDRYRLNLLMVRLDKEIFDQGVSEGEMNYILTQLVLSWLGDARYSEYNSAIGVLECVKQELYRRAVAPYEQKKAEENGDVYCEAAALATK